MNNDLNFLESFIESAVSERGLSKNTVLAYMLDLKDFFKYCESIKSSVINLKASDIVEYIKKSSLRNKSAATLARKISCLKQFYNFLVSEKYISYNPALEIEHPKKSENLPKAIDLEHIELLMKAAYEDTTPEGVRNVAILEILYSTGMRISELITLKHNWFTHPIESGEGYKVFSILGKGSKERLIIMNRKAIDTLNHYLEYRNFFIRGSHDPVFLFPSYKKSGKVTHLSRQMCFFILKKLALIAGLDPSVISPHKIRHSFASHILQKGASLRAVQDLMGHADITSTQIYTKVLSEQAKTLVFEHHPLTKTSN